MGCPGRGVGYLWGIPPRTGHVRPVLLLSVLLAACTSTPRPREREAAGGRYYGGVFNTNESEDISSLFPLNLTRSASHRLAAQVYEGLVRFDQADLSVQPALADSWTVDTTRTVYTFKLRPGVRFHDDTCFVNGVGREVTATDVLDSFTALCSHGPLNQMFWLFQDKVAGANAQYAATVKGMPGPGVRGVEVIDPLSVRITLTAPWPNFLQVLAHQGCWIFPREAIAHYGVDVQWHPVGTGPFRVKRFIRGKVLVLERWADYWGVDEHGNRYPFLDAVRCTFEKDKGKELDEFLKGNLSVVYELPQGRTDVLGGAPAFQVQTIPGLIVQFYGFDRDRPPFDDVRIRQAFNLAIDRQALVDSTLNGLAVPATHGVVPPGFKDYPYGRVPRLGFDPERARALLAEAGHPGGTGLPTIHLQVNNDGFGYVRVAEFVRSMLEQHLGVRVITSVLPADQYYLNMERGNIQLWREGWVADHPDPENFLALFHGKSVPLDTAEPSYLNSTRYRDAVYDSLLDQALRTEAVAHRMDLLARAETRLMEQAIVDPLYHERTVRLLQPWVRDFPINGMEYRDLRGVWFDPKADEP